MRDYIEELILGLNLTGYNNLPSVYGILYPPPRHFNCRCVATPFEHRALDEELEQCEKYFHSINKTSDT